MVHRDTIISGVWPSFSQLDWINKVYPNLRQEDKPLECVQEAGEILYLVSQREVKKYLTKALHESETHFLLFQSFN